MTQDTATRGATKAETTSEATSRPRPLQEARAHVEHEARRARDWLFRESPLAHTRLGRDVRARAMALERARLSRLPTQVRGLELSAEALATMLKGHPTAPPGAKLAPSPPAPAVLGHFRTFSEGPDRLRALL